MALPLFFIPVMFFEMLGWQEVDPYASRVVAAALFGIGIESLLGRNADASAFMAMLNLKVIWSGVTVVGIAWTLAQSPQGRPFGAWAILATFLLFHCVWLYWRQRLKKIVAASAG